MRTKIIIYEIIKKYENEMIIYEIIKKYENEMIIYEYKNNNVCLLMLSVVLMLCAVWYRTYLLFRRQR